MGRCLLSDFLFLLVRDTWVLQTAGHKDLIYPMGQSKDNRIETFLIETESKEPDLAQSHFEILIHW